MEINWEENHKILDLIKASELIMKSLTNSTKEKGILDCYASPTEITTVPFSSQSF